jgi:hypothetical protein
MLCCTTVINLNACNLSKAILLRNKTKWVSVVSTETCHHITVTYLLVASVTNVITDCCTLIISHKAKLTSSEIRVLAHQRQFVFHELMLTSTLLLKTQPCNEVLATAAVHIQNTFRQYVPCRALPFSASGTLSQKDVSEGERYQLRFWI